MRRLASLALALLACALVTSGCSTDVSTAGPRPRRADPPPPLVLGDLSNEAVLRLLDARWSLPQDARVALVQLSHESEYAPWRFDDASFVTSARAAAALAAEPEVHDAVYLPAFLLPKGASLEQVREAGARAQAEWVLLYTSRVSIDTEPHVFVPDVVYLACRLECALFDVRTGLVPFTSRRTQTFEVEEQGRERWSEQILRSEQEAVEGALLATVADLSSFLAACRAQAAGAK
ncbi:MAG: hypothetical protein H6828_08260 [Planctomycetes bacterium]|nr:hypothetical protein [Planctomycetota bacterium]